MKIAFLMFLLYLTLPTLAQLRCPVVGTYRGKSAQGMAIWGDKAYLFNDGGHCRIINLKTEQIEGEYDLASARKDNHVNNASFGNEVVDDDCQPVLYISETNGHSRCFVERMGDTCSVIMQTIQIVNKGKNVFVQSWVVDRKKNALYTVTRMPVKNSESVSKTVKIEKYRLPKLEEGKNITFTQNDCLESYCVEFASGTQGGFIKGNYLYIASGLQESARERYNAKRAIQVINLKKKRLMKKIDISHVTTNEPEGFDLYKGKAMLFCGQEGGIYEVKLK